MNLVNLFSLTYGCVRAGGNGELESVDHGRSRDSRNCLSRRQGQIFSETAKEWPQTEFAGKRAGCARVHSSSSPYFLIKSDFSGVSPCRA